nr:hypothetical protein [Cronobacter sakazakii]
MGNGPEPTVQEERALARIALDWLALREILDGVPQEAIDGGWTARGLSDYAKQLETELAALRERAEPVAWTEKCEITNMRATGLYLRGFPDSSQCRDIPLYTAPPAPVVPDECPAEIRDLIASHSDALFTDDDAQEIWNACRAAMLTAPAAAPAEITALERQRDDLLAALEGVVPLVEGEWPEGHWEAQPILDAARSAIGSAKDRAAMLESLGKEG